MPIGFDSLSNLFNMGLSSRNTPGQTKAFGDYGNKYDKLGRPLLLRPGRSATNVFNGNATYLNMIPMNKFMFYVKFYRPHSSGTQTEKTTEGTAFDWSKGVGLAIKKIDRPSIIMQTETLNQYNKIRKIPLKREYGDISITYHDTHDMRVRAMIHEYYAYYFGDGLKTNYLDWSYDQTYNEFYGGGGFRIHKDKTPDLNPFFSHIEVYQFTHGSFNLMTLVNPYITSYDPDTLSYEEGNVTQEVTMKIGFEGLLFNSARLLLDQDLADETLLSKADFYEPETAKPVGEELPTGWIPLPEPKGPEPIQTLLDRLHDAVLTGDDDTARVITDSVLDSLGYFDFNGINVGAVLDAARYGGFNQAIENVLLQTDVKGAKEVIIRNGLFNDPTATAVLGVNGLLQGAGYTLTNILGVDPNIGGGTAAMGNFINESNKDRFLSLANTSPVKNALDTVGDIVGSIPKIFGGL